MPTLPIRPAAGLVMVIALLVGGAALRAPAMASVAGRMRHAGAQRIAHPQVGWARPGRPPLADRTAALLVTPEPENRTGNTAANDYVPTNSELRAFRSAMNVASGGTVVALNHWDAYVTGRSDLPDPSTDELIQWAAHKWGIPEDWLRAVTAFESLWHQDWRGDLTVVKPSWYTLYPSQARSTDGMVYQSMGIAQVKWIPGGQENPGTNRLRWESTAFNLDYLGATIRFYYDGDCDWCGQGYRRGEKWQSIAAWNQPTPWDGPKQQWYIAAVKRRLANRSWEQPRF